jgi:hypothetical protein
MEVASLLAAAEEKLTLIPIIVATDDRLRTVLPKAAIAAAAADAAEAPVGRCRLNQVDP